MVVDRRQVSRERRASRRIKAVFAVKKTVGTRVQLGQAEDIGPTGMTVRRPKDGGLPANTPVSLTFELPGTAEPIAADGVVINDVRAGIFRRTGVRFIGLRPEHQRLIASYCRRSG
jgi:hypothetical protein